MIISLLPIVLNKDRAPHLDKFIEFLETGCDGTTRITLDQWDSFLSFNQHVNYDLSNFDEDGACKRYMYVSISVAYCDSLVTCITVGPVLLDEYVEWRKENA